VEITPGNDWPTFTLTAFTAEPVTVMVMLPDGSSFALPTACDSMANGVGYICVASYTPIGSPASLSPVFYLQE
jgi:hypothetical protein